jgi:hypothetical protein
MLYSYPCQELNYTEGNAATVYPVGAGVSRHYNPIESVHGRSGVVCVRDEEHRKHC